jgi:hypothetical protein
MMNRARSYGVFMRNAWPFSNLKYTLLNTSVRGLLSASHRRSKQVTIVSTKVVS